VQVLITGIAGFAGSHLAEYALSRSDCEVIGIVRQHTENIAHLQDRLTLFRGDLREPALVKQVLHDAQPDLIFHLAAVADVGMSWRDPWGTLEANVRSQVNLLEAAVTQVPFARVLVVSSNEVYGLVEPENLPTDETAPFRPENPYGVSKVVQDLLAWQYFRGYGLSVVRVRPFNHIGPRQKPAFVAAAFAQQIAEIEAGLRPPVIKVGNLETRRDFTDVRDVVRAYWLALTQGTAGDVYNVGTGIAHSIRELLEVLLSFSSAEITVKQDPTRLRPVDVPVSICDAGKLCRTTGWTPVISFERSLADVLDDWRQRVRQPESETLITAG